MKLILLKLLQTIAFFAAGISILALVMLLCGLRPYILKSGSMEPEYTAGSLIWVNTNVNADAVKIGDVLVYRAETGTLVMHRLVAKNTFKGDANDLTEYIELSASNFIGREVFHIPGLGYFVDQLLSIIWLPWGIAAAFVIISCLPWKTNALSVIRR